MGKTKLLVLTKVEMQPNEIGQEKIDNAVAKQREDDEDGLDEDFYDRLGITPRGKQKSEIIDGQMYLEPEEMEEVMYSMILDLASFDTCEDDDLEGSTITLKNRRTFSVLEDSNEVYAQIYVLNQSWWEKIQDRITLLKIKIKNKFNKVKQTN
jgi:hypothetical protein